jgi:biopolymer transport protein ExbB
MKLSFAPQSAVGFLLSSTVALAQTARPAASPVLPAGTAAEAAQHTYTLWEVLRSGGYFMIPLGVLSVFTLLLIFIFFFTVRRGNVVTAGFLQTADARLRKRDYLGLLSDSSRHGEMLARVVRRTLDFVTKNSGASIDAVREIAESEGIRQSANLNQRVSYLADMGAIAPMLGLLGTVSGMIKAFSALGADVAASKPLTLAQGVSEALVCTAAGRLVGIMAFSAYALFRTRAGRLTADLEAATTQFFAMFTMTYAPARTSARRELRDPMMLEEDI